MIRYADLPIDAIRCLESGLPSLAAVAWLRAHPESDRTHASVTSRMTVLHTRVEEAYVEGDE